MQVKLLTLQEGTWDCLENYIIGHVTVHFLGSSLEDQGTQ